MSENKAAPSSTNIKQIAIGFWSSKVLLAAVHFELFTKLASKNEMSGPEIKETLQLEAAMRNIYDFLDSLVALGFLERKGILENAKYSNSIETDFFLDKNKPDYIGGMIEMLNNRQYQFWGSMEEGLRSGLAQNESKNGSDLFTELYKDEEKLNGFLNAMSSNQLGNFTTFLEKFDLSSYRTLTDVGGASGLMSTMAAQKHPHMACISFDLPAVAPIANKNILALHLEKQVKTVNGDFFKDPFPPAEIITMANILHDWDEKTKLMLIKKAYEALPQGGVLIAIESIIDENRSENLNALLASLNMLIETGKGFNYTFSDFKNWTLSAGFKKMELMKLAGSSSAVIAYK